MGAGAHLVRRFGKWWAERAMLSSNSGVTGQCSGIKWRGAARGGQTPKVHIGTQLSRVSRAQPQAAGGDTCDGMAGGASLVSWRMLGTRRSERMAASSIRPVAQSTVWTPRAAPTGPAMASPTG